MKILKMLTWTAVLAVGLAVTAEAKTASKKTPPKPAMTQAEAQQAYDALKQAHPALVSETETLHRHRVEAEAAKPKLTKKAFAAKKAELAHEAESWNKSYDREVSKLETAKDAADAKVSMLTTKRDELKGKNADASAVESQIAVAQKELAAAEASVALLKKLQLAVDMVMDAKESGAAKK